MKKIILVLLLLVPCASYGEETGYITDHITALLRGGEGTRYKILRQLPTGTPVTVLSENPTTGYSKVRLKDGTVGYLLTRFLVDQPVARWKLARTEKKLAQLRQENQRIKQQLQTLQAHNQDALTENKSLATKKEKLAQQLQRIQQTAANAMAIERQRNQLQERVVNLERELHRLKRENQALQDSTSQDWFMIGAGVLFSGILLGLILPKIRWRRKTASWDSF